MNFKGLKTQISTIVHKNIHKKALFPVNNFAFKHKAHIFAH